MKKKFIKHIFTNFLTNFLLWYEWGIINKQTTRKILFFFPVVKRYAIHSCVFICFCCCCLSIPHRCLDDVVERARKREKKFHMYKTGKKRKRKEIYNFLVIFYYFFSGKNTLGIFKEYFPSLNE